MKAENTDEFIQEILNRRIGILGVGQMGSSLLLAFANYLKGLNRNMLEEKGLFYLYDPNLKALETYKTYGFRNISDNEQGVFTKTGIIFICVKPDLITKLLSENKNSITKDTLIVSIVAGASLDYIAQLLKTEANPNPRVIRIMTNHHCFINEGASVYSISDSCSNLDEMIIKSLLSNVGIIKQVKESQMNAYTAFSGSGPAFVYHFIESLIDGALHNGIDTTTAREYAIQLIYSSGKYLKETNDKNPNSHKYIVTTPGGTTITGLTELDRNKFKYSVISALTKATERAAEMEKEKMKLFAINKF
jgi:pyrroline-5-carboxylate reductase